MSSTTYCEGVFNVKLKLVVLQRFEGDLGHAALGLGEERWRDKILEFLIVSRLSSLFFLRLLD